MCHREYFLHSCVIASPSLTHVSSRSANWRRSDLLNKVCFVVPPRKDTPFNFMQTPPRKDTPCFLCKSLSEWAPIEWEL